MPRRHLVVLSALAGFLAVSPVQGQTGPLPRRPVNEMRLFAPGIAAGAAEPSTIEEPARDTIPRGTLRPVPLPGARVRVRRGFRHVEGTLEAVGDSFAIRTGARSAVVLRPDEIAVLEWPAGRKRATGRGLGYGAGIGAGIGLVIGAVAAPDCSSEWLCFGPEVTAPAGALVGAGAGAIIGALIGSTSWVTVWESAASSGAPMTAVVYPVLHARGVGLAARVPL